ncbi:hypothetical protein F5050DRAFT_1072223 [Lentinula boryana]|uniref:Uncharacterized protein n=1 Tax=Lentinula boryana TaxID=40481 RepID=A0ABQ8QKU8_9AGAR|nr:hypothetical protein F5050DRAFT_1072223 [Lentinula boryana]
MAVCCGHKDSLGDKMNKDKNIKDGGLKRTGERVNHDGSCYTPPNLVTFFPAALRRMLHLSLPANTTSFKRSFEQFGVDLDESPITGIPEPGGSSAENRASGSADNGSNRIGNERKRARSASSLSDGNESLNSSRSSTFTASSDTSLSEDNEPIAESSGSSSSRLVTGVTPLLGPHPPRLPTPDIQDIEMPDYDQAEDHPLRHRRYPLYLCLKRNRSPIYHFWTPL